MSTTPTPQGAQESTTVTLTPCGTTCDQQHTPDEAHNNVLAAHPTALTAADVERIERHGIRPTMMVKGLVEDMKKEAYDAGRNDVLENGDGFHTFDELYEARMLFHAAFAEADNRLCSEFGADYSTVKSWRHSDGEECFGGGWFIVVTTLENGMQISQHYAAEHWDLFQVPEVETPPEFDGHTTADVHARLRAYLADDYEEANTHA